MILTPHLQSMQYIKFASKLMESDTQFQKQLTLYCFSNLENYLTTKEMLPYPDHFDSHSYPLFVTFYSKGHLRGCIGTFKSEILGKNL